MPFKPDLDPRPKLAPSLRSRSPGVGVKHPESLRLSRFICRATDLATVERHAQPCDVALGKHSDDFPDNQPQRVEPRRTRGGPQSLAMPDDDAIGCKHLDRSHSARAKQPLKTVQLALAFEHEADNLALRLISLHRSET